MLRILFVFLSLTAQIGFAGPLWEARSTTCLSYFHSLNEDNKKTLPNALNNFQMHLRHVLGTDGSRQSGLPRVNLSSQTPLQIGKNAAVQRLQGIEYDASEPGKRREDAPNVQGFSITGKNEIRAYLDRIRATQDWIAKNRSKNTYTQGWFYWENLATAMSSLIFLLDLESGKIKPPVFDPASPFGWFGDVIWLDFLQLSARHTDWTLPLREKRDDRILQSSKPRWSLWSDTVSIPNTLLSPENNIDGMTSPHFLPTLPIHILAATEYVPLYRLPEMIFPTSWTHLSIDQLLTVDQSGVPTLSILTRSHPDYPKYPKPKKAPPSLIPDPFGWLLPRPHPAVKSDSPR